MAGRGVPGDGRRANKPIVAIGTASGDVILWNYGSASEPTLLPRFHMESVVALAIDPGGEQLATGGYGNRIRLWIYGAQVKRCGRSTPAIT